MWWLWVIIVLLVICAAVTVGIYLFTFHYPEKNHQDDFHYPDSPLAQPYKEKATQMIRDMRAVPCEWVETSSFDGLKLAGRYYEVAPGGPLALCFHGYKSTAMKDFCGGAKHFLSRGINVLAVDQRAHGRSEGRVISFGINERQDVVFWCRWARARFGDIPFYLVGVSMGAATVLLSADLDLPDNLKAIMADCPYASPREIIKTVAGYMHIPGWTIIFAILGAKLFGHFYLSDISAVDTVAKSKVPVLIIHGKADDFVPEQMSAEIAEKNPGIVTRVTVDGAGHAMSYMVDPAKYTGALDSFIDSLNA